MIAKMWIALALGATMLVGGAATVAALGNMNGDCLQDKLQLKDGSCEDCPSDALSDEVPDELAGDCDSCNDYLYEWDFLYEDAGPHSSACGQE
jgi:hypothetical protein